MNQSERDYELLSSYIDGTLDEIDRAALESRLAQEVDLRRELAALRQTVALVKNLPTLKAPRDFTLTPAVMKQRRQPRLLMLLPVLSAAAAMILMLLGGTLLLTRNAAPPSTGQVAMGAVELKETPEATIELFADDTAMQRAMMATEDVNADIFSSAPADEMPPTRAGEVDEAEEDTADAAAGDAPPVSLMPQATMVMPASAPTVSSLNYDEEAVETAAADVVTPVMEAIAAVATDDVTAGTFMAPEAADVPETDVQPEEQMSENENLVNQDGLSRLAVPMFTAGVMLALTALILYWRLRQ